MAYGFSRWRRNRRLGWFPALLLSVTVVSVSQGAWALSEPAPAASEPHAQSPGPLEPTATDSSHDQAPNPRKYLLAIGGALATGPAGLTGGFGTIAEGYVRAGVLPWLGVGVSYLDLSVSNTDNYAPISAQALELNASWHPLKYSSVDPFLQLGELRIFNVSGNDYTPPSLWSTEGQLGVNYVVPHLAVGVQVRHGFAAFTWTMLGVQLEGRI